MRVIVTVVALAAAGCGDSAVQIVVDGDLPVPDAIDGICLSVHDTDPGGGEFNRFYSLVDDLAALPQSLAVDPGGAGSADAIVRGYRDGVEVARDRAGVSFGGGDVTLELLRCYERNAGGPSVRDAFAAEAGTRVAASVGRGGTLVVAVGPTAGTVLRAAGGSLEATALAAPTDPDVVDLLAFDADADCDDDILILRGNGPPVLWRRGPDGSFAVDPGAIAAVPVVSRAAAADVDGDGDLDLALGGGTALLLVRNDGSGGFQPDGAAFGAGVVDDLTALAFGDIDADGQVDLVAGQGGAMAASARVFFNDVAGTGAFELSVAALPELPLQAREVVITDTDGDGANDVLIASAAAQLHLYINRGDGRLEDRSFVRLASVDPVDATAAAMADWDGDCAVDLVVATAGAPLAWRGSDTGVFAGDDALAPTGSDVLFADIDDDNAVDLVVSGGAEGVTWIAR